MVAPEDALGEIEALVRVALDAGSVELAYATARVLQALPSEVHYATTGRVADVLARITCVWSEHERPWRPVVGRLELEDWSISAEGGSA